MDWTNPIVIRAGKKVFEKILILTLIFLLCTAFLYLENNSINVTEIEVENSVVPQDFDGYRIVHLSDLHSKLFGEGQKVLVDKIRSARPDIIVFTGDMIDSRNYNEEAVLALVNEAVKIAPFYYVNGNHEKRSGKFNILEGKLKAAGAIVLRNTSTSILKGKDKIIIAGIDDPTFTFSRYGDRQRVESEIARALNGIDSLAFKILLSHRPEQFDTYAESGIDLTFSGHAHGGQIRLPFIGGLFAPQQGILPKYTEGKYIKENSAMIVSRGLGNSLFPQRLFNKPEVVVVTLKR